MGMSIGMGEGMGEGMEIEENETIILELDYNISNITNTNTTESDSEDESENKDLKGQKPLVPHHEVYFVNDSSRKGLLKKILRNLLMKYTPILKNWLEIMI